VVVRLLTLGVLVFGAMLIEAMRARANERAQRALGGVEPRLDVYPIMQVAYPGVFLVMIFEGLLRPDPPFAVVAGGLALFAAGKALKWWAIVALGSRWTFRVIVVPGAALVRSGPYRFLRHPNYVGVAGELVGAALVANAPIAGTLGTALFGGLMLLRVRIENRALNAILRRG
jgi:methyltransferase